MTATESRTETNRAIVEKLYDAAVTGDHEALAGCVAEDIVVVEPDYLPYGGTYRGLAEFAALLPLVSQCLDLTSLRVKYTIADGDRVAACLAVKDRATGEDTDFIEQSTLRDGRIVEIKLFYCDAQSMIGQPKLV